MPRRKKDPGSHIWGEEPETLLDRGIADSAEPPPETVQPAKVDPGPVAKPEHYLIPAEVLDRLRRGIEDGLRAEAFERTKDNATIGYYYVPGRPLMGAADVELSRDEAKRLGIGWPRNCDLIRVIF